MKTKKAKPFIKFKKIPMILNKINCIRRNFNCALTIFPLFFFFNKKKIENSWKNAFPITFSHFFTMSHYKLPLTSRCLAHRWWCRYSLSSSNGPSFFSYLCKNLFFYQKKTNFFPKSWGKAGNNRKQVENNWKPLKIGKNAMKIPINEKPLETSWLSAYQLFKGGGGTNCQRPAL